MVAYSEVVQNTHIVRHLQCQHERVSRRMQKAHCGRWPLPRGNAADMQVLEITKSAMCDCQCIYGAAYRAFAFFVALIAIGTALINATMPIYGSAHSRGVSVQNVSIPGRNLDFLRLAKAEAVILETLSSRPSIQRHAQDAITLISNAKKVVPGS